MKQILSIMTIVLVASCNSGKETKPGEKTDTLVGVPIDTSRPKDPKDIEVPLDGMDRIGGLVLGLVDTKTIELLGQPASKSKEVEWGADGLMHQDWEYLDKGILLNMTRDKTTQQIFSILVAAPSNLKTAKGIGIGSSYAEVMTAYDKEVNKEESTEEVVVVGSVYGGIIFNFSGGKVQRIFVGAAAE